MARRSAGNKRGRKVADEDDEFSGDEAPASPPSSKRQRGGKKATKAKAKSAKATKGAAKAAKGGAKAKKVAKRTVKQMKPMELLERAVAADRWWEHDHEDGINWSTMEHAGVVFPPEYEPHNIPIKYDGATVQLTPPQEEIVTLYAHARVQDAQQLSRPEWAKIFNANFLRDFRKLLPADSPIRDASKLDVSAIEDHLREERDRKKAMTKEEKAEAAAGKLELQLKHSIALVDGRPQKMGNYTIEPPALFRGRGEHPRMGTHKTRVAPEEIHINVSKDAVVPRCHVPGHAWKRVVHDPSVTWLAYWKENVNDSTKYVMLAASSSFKGRSDRSKYEKARELGRRIGSIREVYERMLVDKDDFQRQAGTAMWIIDRLALRVGGEKDDDEADTVGCCSLRVEHLSFPESAAAAAAAGGEEAAPAVTAGGGASDQLIMLDFLGKDSMRYCATIDLGRYGDVGRKVYRNLRSFVKGKQGPQDIFDKLSPTTLNNELKRFMPGLSAKVFRTYNASWTLEKELRQLEIELSDAEKTLEYNRANREVAVLCNHQKSVSKAAAASLEKLSDRGDLLEKQLKELRSMLKKRKKGEDIRLKDTSKPCHSKPTKELTDKQKLQKQSESHLFAKQPSVDSLTKKVKAFEIRVAKARLQLKNKNDNKTVALGTSKINYMDPRITVAWCKRVELPIERVFPKALQKKFPWAMGVATSFTFDE